ncbi:hypothetical protein HPB48_004142 [Haemaphysalis longicornis]|uniref:Speckle-type POZ protein n=1 Tax=Haemaphysalis longicornis TaxID=44386 RepID=A0A9J6FKP0_HAELO|nr:hypothetical protein HPB48_004142 [Haemaphysalis longicornis]
MNAPKFSDKHHRDKDALSAPDGWCRTERKVTVFTYTWMITNFSFYENKCGEKVDSAVFSSVCREDVKWCLEMYPNGGNKRNKGYVSLFLRLVESKKNEEQAKINFSIVNVDGNPTNTFSSLRPERLLVGTSWGWYAFVSKKALMKPTAKLLHDDSLTILCEVSISEGAPVTVSGRNTASAINVPSCRLSEDYGMLFESEQFGDVVFIIGGYELHAHKGILVARCPVFASVFEHDMKERMQNRVDITDIDHDVFHEMLRFIYTGQAPNIDKFPMDLLAAADKYALGRLKAMCEEVVYSYLYEENAAEVLVFADMHSAQQLKTQTMAYICAHASAVKETDGWKSMVSSNPALALEVSMELFTRAASPEDPPAKRMKKQ